MYYSKIRDVHSLSRGTSKSAGIDFYVPKFDDKFIEDLLNKNPNLIYLNKEELKHNKVIRLRVSERILIPSGIKVNIPKGYSLIAFNKSGVATKKGLDVLACVHGSTDILTNKGIFSVSILTKEFIENNNVSARSLVGIIKLINGFEFLPMVILYFLILIIV